MVDPVRMMIRGLLPLVVVAMLPTSCISMPGTNVPSAPRPESEPQPRVEQPADDASTEWDRPALRGPIWAASWAGVPNEVRHITPMIWVRPNTRPQAAAQESRSRPPGRAVAIVWRTDREVATHAMDRVRTPEGTPTDIEGPWFDRGIARVRGKMEEFFAEYHSHGGRLDVLALDFEQGRGIWNFDADRRAESIQAILNDPRGGEIRQALKARGLVEADFDRIHDFQPAKPRYNLDRKYFGDVLDEANPPYVAWNVVMGERMTNAINEAIYEPIKALYPNVTASNYGHALVTRENVVPSGNGHLHDRANHFGTHNSRAFYGAIGHLSRERLPDGSQYGDAPFDVVRWHINELRGIQRSSDVPFHAWVSFKSYNRSQLRDNPYYEELIYHLALCETELFLFWHPPAGGEVTPAHRVAANVLDDCLDELNQWFDDRPRRSVTLQPMAWDSSLVISGMQLGQDKVLWRVTVPPEVSRVRVQQTGEVLTVPSHSRGVWYESAVGVTPQFNMIAPQ